MSSFSHHCAHFPFEKALLRRVAHKDPFNIGHIVNTNPNASAGRVPQYLFRPYVTRTCLP